MEENAVNRIREIVQEGEILDGSEEEEDDDDDDDEEDVDFYLDATDDADVDDECRSRRQYCDRSYLPKPTSPLGKEMEKFKKKMQEELCSSDGRNVRVINNTNAQLWRHNSTSQDDPVAKCCNGSAPSKENYYLSNFHPFVWMPTYQFGNAVDLKDITCLKCKEVGKCNLDKLTYRPMLHFNRTIWVLHHRIKCRSCKKSFTSIDSEFLEQLPTRIVERFPFVAPIRGPGVHEMMIYQFVTLNLKQTGFGTFVDSINQMHRLHHTRDTLSYYDCVSARKSPNLHFVDDRLYEVRNVNIYCFISGYTFISDHYYLHTQPYSSFHDSNEYCGIKLTRNLWKACVLVYWISREPYAQASFQLCYDEGNSADHTHKFANTVRAGPLKGRAFAAAYSVLALIGFVNLFRLTYTKGNQELEGLLESYKEARTLVGAPELKCFSSDNLNGDGNLWRRRFQELSKDTQPYHFSSKNLPRISIDPSSVDYLYTSEMMNRVAADLLSKYGSLNKKSVYGFDAEWNRGEKGVRLIIIALPSETVKLFHLSAAGIYDANGFPNHLKTFLEMKHLMPTGVNVGGDCGRMRRFGVHMERRYELMDIAKVIDPSLSNYGMAKLAETFMSVSVDKFGQNGDYAENPLAEDLQLYAALDGRLSLRLFHILSSKASIIEPIREAPKNLQEGKIAELLTSGNKGAQSIARVEIKFIAGFKVGDVRKWGDARVTKGRAVVKICTVYVENSRPPFSFRPLLPSNQQKWKRSERTLLDLLGEEIMVNTSSLVLSLDDDAEMESDGEVGDAMLRICHKESLENNGVDAACNENQNDDALQSDNQNKTATSSENFAPDENLAFLEEQLTLLYEDDDSDDTDVNSPRTRSKHDIFHELQNISTLKSDPLRPFISRLLIHSTYQFDSEDFKAIEKYIVSVKDWSDDDYTEKLMDHFYHNREWWRQRCKISTPRGDDHAKNLATVSEHIQKDDTLKRLWDKELEAYFEKLIFKALRGDFEELEDVRQIVRVGTDSHGLPLYIRLKGTVRNENLHQKCKTAMGPWKIGAKTGHHMLVFLCYRFNINTGRTRNGGYNFGHYEHYYIDRIQNRVQEIYNVLIWPRHKNVLNFKTKKDFVSVGIGPLSFDEKFVQKSETPAKCLKGDLYFVAKQMRLLYPLRLMGTAEECKIYSEFFGKGQNKPTVESFTSLAVTYNRLSNGTTIFPKLPSMVKAYYKTWEKNQNIRCSEMAIGSESKSVLRNLFFTTSTAASILPQPTEILEGYRAEEEVDHLNNCVTNEARAVGEDMDSNDDISNPTEPNEEQPQQPTVPHNFVPPTSAPMQKSYVSNSNKRFQRCAAFPFCSGEAAECGGWASMFDCKRRVNYFLDKKETPLEENKTLGETLNENSQLVQQLNCEKKIIKNEERSAKVREAR